MTYRDDLLAKRERAEQLASELRDVRRRMTEVERLREREHELERALGSASEEAGRARARVSLPLLSKVKVASPCHERWEEMSGGERVRHCGRCEKNVYDLSAMTAEAAETLLKENGEGLCVRFYRRADGTVMTSDCAVGARRRRVRNVALAAGAATASLVATAGLFVCTVPTMGSPVVMGEMTIDHPYEVGEYDDEIDDIDPDDERLGSGIRQPDDAKPPLGIEDCEETGPDMVDRGAEATGRTE